MSGRKLKTLKIELKLNDRYTKQMRRIQRFQQQFARKFNQSARLIQSGASLYFALRPALQYEQQLVRIAVAGNLSGKALQSMRSDVLALNAATGDGLSNIGQVLAEAQRVTGRFGSELRAVSKNALFLKKIYDFSTDQSLAAQSALMRSFGVSATTAGDAVAYLAQQGGDARGELLESLSEYAVQLQGAGLTFGQAIAMFQQGLGSWSIDKAADVLKESSIKLKQAGKPVQAAFSELGLENLLPQLQKGKLPITQAWAAIAKQLPRFTAPVQLRLITTLMGAPGEDVGVKQVLKLLNAVNRNPQIKGAMRTQHQLWNATPAALFARMKGQVENLSVAFGSALLPVLIPIVEKMTEWGNTLAAYTKALPNLTKLVVSLTVGVLVLAAGLGAVAIAVGALKIGFTALAATIGAFKLVLMPLTVLIGLLGLKVLLIAAVIAVVAYGIYQLVKNWDQFTEKVDAGLQWIKTGMHALWNWLLEKIKAGMEWIAKFSVSGMFQKLDQVKAYLGFDGAETQVKPVPVNAAHTRISPPATHRNEGGSALTGSGNAIERKTVEKHAPTINVYADKFDPILFNDLINEYGI